MSALIRRVAGTLSFAVVCGLSLPLQAQQPGGQRADTTRAAGGSADFARLTRDATMLPGFFDFYQKNNALYLVVPKDRLGQDFLMTAEIGRGIGAQNLFGGTMLNIFESSVVALERRGERIYLVERPVQYRASDAATLSAVRLSFG